jgi:hypothetical protein
VRKNISEGGTISENIVEEFWVTISCNFGNFFQVFLMNGQVHLIPDDPSFPRKIESPKEGVALVRRSCEATVSHPISAAVRARCNQSRPQTNGLSHRAQCLLPSTLALLCKDRPDLLAAAAVAVFNGREAHDSKVLNIFYVVLLSINNAY